jgi:MFS family permease
MTAATVGTRWGVFANRDFRIYWSGGFVSNIGTWLQNVTASVLVLTLTHSPLMVGVLNFATFAPIFALSMFGGMLSDRFDRRRVIVYTQLFSLAVAAVITVLTGIGAMNAPILIALATLLGCSYALAKPALSALLPSLVERSEIANATAINTLQFNLGQVVGSALSALLLAVSTPTFAFGMNTLSFSGPILAMYLLRRSKLRETKRRATLRGSGREGMALALGSPAILALLIAVALSNASVEALRTLAPEIADKTLNLSPNAAGLIITSYSIGATSGLVLFGVLSKRIRPGPMLAIAFGLQAAGVAGVALSSSLLPAGILAAPIGLGFAMNIPLLTAGLQLLSPEEFRGRVMSMFSMIHLGLRPVFSLAAGAMATVLNLRLTLGLFVIFPLVAITLTARSGRFLDGTRADDAAVPASAEDGAAHLQPEKKA